MVWSATGRFDSPVRNSAGRPAMVRAMSLAVLVASFPDLTRISSASASARASTRRSASRSTFPEMTIDRASETASTTRSRVATVLTAMRAGTDRRAEVISIVPSATAPAPRAQSARVSASVTDAASAAAIRTREIHSARREARASPHPRVPKARSTMPAPRREMTAISRVPVSRDPCRNAATATPANPRARTTRDRRLAPTRWGRRRTMAAPATATRKVANSTANRSWAPSGDMAG